MDSIPLTFLEQVHSIGDICHKTTIQTAQIAICHSVYGRIAKRCSESEDVAWIVHSFKICIDWIPNW